MFEKNVSNTISIIMATYNRGHFICETLDSILNQTFLNWECLIIDDGSTDTTRDVIEPYLIKDSRLKYYSRTNNYKKGLPGCRNQGLNLAKGDYVIFFDDDDIVHPDNLKICIELITNEKVDYVRYLREVFVGNFLVDFDRSISFDTKILTLDDLPRIIKGEIPFNSCQILWNKKCFENNYFNENLMYAEEWECYCRILTYGFKGISINKTLFYGRKHSDSNTGEYKNRNIIRLQSHVQAALLVMSSLQSKALLKKDLKKFFVRLSLELKSLKIINTYLALTNSGYIEKLKYNLGFCIYPFLKYFFAFKVKWNS